MLTNDTPPDSNRFDAYRLPYLKGAAGAVGAVCLAFGILPFALALSGWYPTASEERASAVKDLLSQYSNFGQMFGAIGTLFSGLALIGVIYAVILQRAQLAEQRRELELTRGELARTAAAQEKAEQALAEQVKASRDASLLNAANALAQVYATQFATNAKPLENEYRKSHDAEREKSPKLGSEIPRVKDTTLGKLVFFQKQLEALFLQMLAASPGAAKVTRDPSWGALEETYPKPEQIKGASAGFA